MSEALPLILRDPEPEDTGFVVDGWVQEMRHSPWTRHEPSSMYYPAQHELIHGILREASTVLACDRDKPSLLFGCIVVSWLDSEPVVHWLYTKGSYRGMGVARALMLATVGPKPERILCTQPTKLLEDQALVARYNIVCCPHILQGFVPAAPEAAVREQMAG